eukprot:scaffold1229_cov400-Prasinococcus_capsulatus_cf.AAC.4
MDGTVYIGPILWLSAVRICGSFFLGLVLLLGDSGGGINYIAVADTLKLSPESLAAGITVDNLWGLLYFPTLGALCSLQSRLNLSVKETVEHPDELSTREVGANEDKRAEIKTEHRAQSDQPAPTDTATVGVQELAVCVALSVGIIAVAQVLNPGSVLPTATVLTVTLATIAPTQLAVYSPAAELLGKLLLFQYFASAGAGGGSVLQVLQLGPLFTFCGIMYVVHLWVVVGVGLAMPSSFREVRSSHAARSCHTP